MMNGLGPIRSQALAAFYRARDHFRRLDRGTQIMVLVGAAVVLGAMSMFAYFHESILLWMVDASKSFKKLSYGWVIILLGVFAVSFPPMVGYSALSMFTGMVFGFPWGWPLLAIGTVIGSFLCFVLFRYHFQERAKALAQRNVTFMAFARTLGQDSIMLLWMIRLCPLPYSFSNAAMTSVHTITPLRFFLATAMTTPKLLLHVFVGDRIAKLGAATDSKTKVLNTISIGIAMLLGVLVSYIIYQRTSQRVAELQAAHPELNQSGLGQEIDGFEIDGSDDEMHSVEFSEVNSYQYPTRSHAV